MIIELPGYVDSSFVSEIKKAVAPFVKNSTANGYNRNGKTVCVSEILDLKEVDQKLAELFASVQNELLKLRYSPMLNSGDSGYEYHLYNPGDICREHADGELSFSNNGTSLLRYASLVLHLSTIHEGGELIFPNQNRSVKTELGKIVVFPPSGFYQHYTTPSNEPREVIVTWFVYNNVTVLKNGN